MTQHDHRLPSRDRLKSQARRLRADLTARGQTLSHGEALELVAHQWGARDWNTLSARAPLADTGWAPGQRVSGRYLGHAFTGTVRAARLSTSGFWTLTIRFDAPIDVVTSALFSSLRRQVSVTVNATGRSPKKTSDGRPHLVLDAAA